MKILIVAATNFEILPLLEHLDKNASSKTLMETVYKQHTIQTLITGVGGMNTAFALARYSKIKDLDLAINVGIAGSYKRQFELGDVVEVVKDRFGDLGVEEADGSFTDIFDLQLAEKDSFPYQDGWV